VADTCTVADAVRPSLVAVMAVVPVAKALSSPDAFTLATEGVDEVQETARPFNGRPALSATSAASWVVSPTVVTTVAGETVREATGTAVTVMVADPLRPSLVAVIVADPAPMPVIRPEDDTVATLLFDVLHAMLRPARARPPASRVTAASTAVSPMRRATVDGETVTEATGAPASRSAGAPDTSVGGRGEEEVSPIVGSGQQYACPVAVSPQCVAEIPCDNWRNTNPPATGVGAVLGGLPAAFHVPSPIWPAPFAPQQ
jgi:hypothetical protein